MFWLAMRDRLVYQNNVSSMHLEYDYPFLLPFERDFNPVHPTYWFQRNWHQSVTISLLYMLFCYVGQAWMRERKPFDLKRPLIFWNWALAVFSILGTVRCLEECLYSVTKFGFDATLCYSADPKMAAGYWSLLFAVSKVVELGDTVFLVLRKRPVIFLHWYHHVSVLIFVWHSGAELTAAGRWFIMVNFTVHAIMYAYFALRAMGLRLPKLVSMLVTSLQLSQMVLGVYIIFRVYQIKSTNTPCQQSWQNLILGAAIYSSYFLLFGKFFIDAYLKKGVRPSKKAAKAE